MDKFEIVVAVVPRSNRIDDIQIGEVIEICPEGFDWGTATLSNPNWRIIKSTLLPTHAKLLKQPHTTSALRVAGKTYPRKSHLLDITKLPDAHLFVGDRPSNHIEMEHSDIVAATIKVT